MRYRLPILLMLKDQSKEPLLDISYQAKMLSLVKRGLSGTNPELFHKMYDENVQKKFAMSVYFPYSKVYNNNNFIKQVTICIFWRWVQSFYQLP